jgi:hypothetical protein
MMSNLFVSIELPTVLFAAYVSPPWGSGTSQTMWDLDPCFYGMHSPRKTSATLIYKKTGKGLTILLSALLGHCMEAPRWSTSMT